LSDSTAWWHRVQVISIHLRAYRIMLIFVQARLRGLQP
jgi:hypothetical protein